MLVISKKRKMMTGVMSPLANKTPDILIFAPPQSRRVKAYQQSLAKYSLPPARLIAYTDYLLGKVSLHDEVRQDTIIRIESSGEDVEAERLILLAHDTKSESRQYLSPAQIMALELDKGALMPTRQWFLGFCKTLNHIKQELKTCPNHRLMNSPVDIMTMFDKCATHTKLEQAGISVPPKLDKVTSFDELQEAMSSKGWNRVFVKMVHGSSATGVVALETNGQRWQATTTVKMIEGPNGMLAYNSRKLQKYTDLNSIRTLINILCSHHIHVERWLPKASINGHVFDLRVVVIAGEAKHVLVRLANGPITNLHLGNKRGDWNAVKKRLGEEVWHSLKISCENALKCFPNSLYVGVDVLVSPSFTKHAILELNAFGDYHKGVLHEGLDTYGAQLKALGVLV